MSDLNNQDRATGDLPAFDPAKPFDVAPTKAPEGVVALPAFDPSKPFSPVNAKPPEWREPPPQPQGTVDAPFEPQSKVEYENWQKTAPKGSQVKLPTGETWTQAETPPPPAPGWFGTAIEAGKKGIVSGLTEVAQAPTAFRERAPEAPDTSAVGKLLAEPISQGWSDPKWWIAHIAHGAAASSPSLALGAAGAGAGSLASPAGAVVGGAGGFALGSVLQSIAPAYQKARADGLPHDQAVDRAMIESGIAGAGGAAMALAPMVSLFGREAAGALKRPISEALAQIFGVQPGIGAAQQTATAALEGKTPTLDELGTSYAENAGMGAAMMGGHAAARRVLGHGAPPVSEPPTPPAPAPTPDGGAPQPLLALPPPATLYGPGEPGAGPGVTLGPNGEVVSGRPAFTTSPITPGGEPYTAPAPNTRVISPGQSVAAPPPVVEPSRVDTAPTLANLDQLAATEHAAAQGQPVNPETHLQTALDQLRQQAQTPVAEPAAPMLPPPVSGAPAQPLPQPPVAPPVAEGRPLETPTARPAEPTGPVFQRMQDGSLIEQESGVHIRQTIPGDPTSGFDIDTNGHAGILWAKTEEGALQQLESLMMQGRRMRTAMANGYAQPEIPESRPVTDSLQMVEPELPPPAAPPPFTSHNIRDAEGREPGSTGAQRGPAFERAQEDYASNGLEPKAPETQTAPATNQQRIIETSRGPVDSAPQQIPIKDGTAEVTLTPHHLVGPEAWSIEARVDGEPQGWLTIGTNRHRDSKWSAASLWVNPDFRNRGIATALYDAADKAGIRPIVPDAQKLSPDGQALWDSIKKRRGLSSYEWAQAPSTEPGVIEGTHTKTGAPIVTVQLPQKVGSDAFKALGKQAREMGGYYSSYRGNGAQPGFIFKTRETADRFAGIARGKEDEVGEVGEAGKPTSPGSQLSAEQPLAHPEYEVQPEPTRGTRHPEAVTTDVEAARGQTDTPTPAQAESGNYRKGRVDFNGLPFVMETPAGEFREGPHGPDGEPAWRAQMPPDVDYGYVGLPGVRASDGDHVDMFLGPHHDSQQVWVIDQVHADTKAWDEPKVMAGFNSLPEARAAYEASFSDGRGADRIGNITPMSLDELKAWLKDGDPTKPLAENASRGEPIYEPVPKEPMRLISWLVQNGGIADVGGNLKHILGGNRSRPGLINNRRGKSLDDATLDAWQEGYLPSHDRPDIQALYDAIDADARGVPQYSSKDQIAADAFTKAMGRNSEIDRLASLYGIDHSTMSREQFWDRVSEHLSLDQAAHEAMRLADEAAATFAEAEQRAREWTEARGDAWEPELLYHTGEPRSLADLELQYRQEESAGAATESARGAEPSRPPAGGEAGIQVGAGQDGSGLGADRGDRATATPGFSLESAPEARRKEAALPGFDRTDQGMQQVMPGMERSATQAAQAREDEASGRLRPKAQQAEPAGMFAQSEPENHNLFENAEPANAPPAQESPTRKIEDAGEKIGGARKDRWAKRALSLDDLQDMTGAEEAKYVTKNAVWPQPDYQALIEGGMEPKTAALLKIVRDRLAATPSRDTPEGRRNYIETLGQVRDAFQGAKTEADLKTARDAVVYDWLGWPRSGYERPAKDVTEKLFSIFKGRKEQLGIGRDDVRKAEAMVRSGFPEAPEEPWLRGVEFRPEPSFRSTSGPGFKEGPPRTAIYRNGKYVRMFDTEDAARGWLRDQHAQRGRDREEGKLPERPHLDNLERTGPDVREGRDVDGNDFVNDFGFRGVEFGNWVASDERQKAVNLAYDGLHDLAHALGVDPKILSLDGQLGLAFGARGSGRAAAHYEPEKMVINLTKLSGAGSLAHEWGHALDHYLGELDRADAHQGAARGATGWYEPRDYTGRRPLTNLRPELASAVDGLMAAIFRRQKTRAEAVRDAEQRVEVIEGNIAEQRRRVELSRDNNPGEAGSRVAAKFSKDSEQYIAQQERILEVTKRRLAEARGDGDIPLSNVDTSYYQNARALSGKAGAQGYWARPTEMFARAFEAHVFDKLVERDRQSQYLVQGVEGGRYPTPPFKGNPYPAGMEREAINKAFDRLVETLKTREGNSGMPTLYSRGDESAVPVENPGIRDALYELARQQAPGLTLKAFDAATRPGVRGSYRQTETPEGTIERIASIALDHTDPRSTLNHEIVHFFRGAGLFKPTEWSLLEREAGRDWRQRFDIDRRYEDQSEPIRQEEAIADAYAAWARGELKGPANGVFGKMRAFFDRVGNWLRGNGFQTVDDIFQRGQSGEIGARPMEDGRPDLGGERESRAPAAPEDPETAAEREALGRIMHTNDRSLWDRARDFIGDIRTDTATRLKQGFLDDLAGLEAALKKDGGAGWQAAKSMPLNMARLTRNLDSVVSTIVGVKHGDQYLGGALQYDPQTGAFSTVEGSKPFAEVFKPVFERGLQDQWALWAIVNRAKRLSAEGRERNVSPEDIERYENLDQKYIQPDGTNLFRETLDQWRDLNKRMLDMAEDTGLLNADQRKLFEHDDYVPFFRALDDEEVAGTTKAGGKGIANIRSGIKQLTGGEQKVNNIYENMVRNLTSLTDRAMKNAAMQKVTAELSGTDALTPLSKVARENLQTPENRARLEMMGFDPDHMTAQAKAAAVDLFGMIAKKEPGVVSVMEDGKPQYYQVNDPLLLRSLVSMGPEATRGLIENVLGGAKKVLTNSVTIDPAFMVANLLRDSVHSWVVTGHGFTPGVDTMKGFVSALRNSPSAMALMAGGSGGGHFYAVAPERVRRMMASKDFKDSVLDAPQKIWHALEHVGRASEMANRIAIYEQAMKEGVSHTEALARAQDMLNFTMRGDFPAMRFLIETVPFMNARLQGLYRLYRGARDNPSSFLLRGGMFAAAAIALWGANHDDERYKALEDWDRQNYLHFFIGDSHYRLPMPFEVGALFGTVPEMLLNYSENGRTKELRDAFVGMVTNQLNLNPTPQLVKPAIDLYANKDSFTGRPIVNQAEERLRPELQYGPQTSQTMIGLAGSLGVSPDQAEALLKGYGGTLATYLLAASDAVLDATGVTPPRATRRWDQMPLVSRFVREEPALGSRWLTEFYELKQDADKLLASVKQYQKLGDAKGAQAILADQENMRKIGIDKSAMAVSAQLGKIRTAMAQINADRLMAPDEKRRRIDTLLAQRNKLAEAVRPMIQSVEQLSARP